MMPDNPVRNELSIMPFAILSRILGTSNKAVVIAKSGRALDKRLWA
jgi:hypothetical protein